MIHEIIAKLGEGAKFFASFDLLKGYWQFPVHSESEPLQAFATHDGLYQFTRVVMGSRNSAAHFQRIMQEILSELLWICVLLYLDDLLVFADNEDDLVAHIDRVLTLLNERGIKLQPKKATLFAEKVLWCGRLISGEGVTINPAFIETVQHMPYPAHAGELQSFLAAANWIRGYISNYAPTVAPLQQLLNAILSKCKRRNKHHASKVLLSAAGWGEEHILAFDRLRQSIAAAVTHAQPDPGKILCMFTDASDHFWGVVLTQVPVTCADDPDKAIKDWEHQPLAFLSGAFSGASARWGIPDKEGFAILEGAKKLSNFLIRKGGFRVFTDHRNLQFIFAPHSMLPTVPKPQADRLERWAFFLRTFEYTIQHVAGEDNVWGDIVSRWAAGGPEVEQHRATLASGCRAVRMRVRGGRIAPQEDVDVSDREAWPSRAEILRAQAAVPPELRAQEHLITDGGGALVNAAGALFVPVNPPTLRVRLLVVAHAGAAGHRRKAVTWQQLQSRFTWPSMEEDMNEFLAACLLCVKTREGGLVPRPLGSLLRADRPRRQICFDFCSMPFESSSGFKYCLVIKDDCSLFTWFCPARDADADTVVHYLCLWFATFGVALQWVSDQGTHFVNSVMRGLRKQLRAEHHFTTAYSAWANGVVERMNRELLRVLRTLLAELNQPEEEWHKLLPTVQLTCNSTTSASRLAGASPFGMNFGEEPTHPPLDTVLGVPGPAEGEPAVLSAAALRHCKALQEQLHRSWTAADEARTRRGAANAAAREQFAREGDFNVGDYVLVYRMVARNKLQVRWCGPYQVTDTINEHVYTVRDIVLGKDSVVHAARLRFYADATLEITEDLKDQAAHDSHRFYVERIMGWRTLDDDTVQLKVRWVGFTAAQDSWEPATALHADVPEVVLRWLTGHAENQPRL